MKKLTFWFVVFCAGLLSVSAQQTVGLFSNESASFDGFTLFAPTHNTTTYLVDNCGELIHSWPSQYMPGLSCYLLEDGTLLRTARIPGTDGGSGLVEMIDWSGNVIWSHSVFSSHDKQHHDIDLLPNGNILIIVRHKILQADLVQAGGTTAEPHIFSEQIVEIEPDLVNGGAKVVWEWKAWDHIIQDADSTKSNYGSVSQNPQLIDVNFLPHATSDWLHANAVDYNADLDQIIFSVRDFSELWIIDHSTTTAEAATSSGGKYGKGGDLLYRWGNPQAYKQGSANDQKIFMQHDTQWIPDTLQDGGKIMLFSNQTGAVPGQEYSTIEVIQPPIDSSGNYTYNGGAYGPINSHWTYKATTPTDFYSKFLSGTQRLPNGNTLICAGIGGRLFEVDGNNDVVWEYVNPVNDLGPLVQNSIPGKNNVFRCYRYPRNYKAFNGKTLTPQGFIESGSMFTCDLHLPPTGTDLIQNEESQVVLYPNPASDFLYIELGQSSVSSMEIYTVGGKLMTSRMVVPGKNEVDIRMLPKGVYIVRINDGKSLRAHKLIKVD